MTELKIDISDLKREGEDLIKELVEFLEEKTNVEVDETTDSIIVKSEEEKKIPKKYLKVLLKKFLHKTELKDFYRVIRGEETSLKVKERKIAEEE